MDDFTQNDLLSFDPASLESLKRTASYVYENYAVIAGDEHRFASKYYENLILAADTIISAFENDVAYFRANSRFRVQTEERVVDFSKINYISRRTIDYIIQHPEEMRPSGYKGIEIGNRRYLPQRSLASNGRPKYDTYENKFLFDFLCALRKELCRLARKAADDIAAVRSRFAQEQSPYEEIYSSIFDKMRNIEARFAEFAPKTDALCSAYSEIWGFDIHENDFIMAEPTPVFTRIPQYGSLYQLAAEWQAILAPSDSAEDDYILSLMSAATLYELYVLINLVQYFTYEGFALIDSEKINYFQHGLYESESLTCKNRFVFKKYGITVTLLYQPVVTDNDKFSTGLYRSCSIPFPSALTEGQEADSGTLYTPDYIIKIERDTGSTGGLGSGNAGSARYIIADAKYSDQSTIKRHYAAALVYKYLFSLTPVNAQDSTRALFIISGKSDSQYNLHDVESVFSGRPRVDAYIIPISEDSPKRNAEILRNMLKKYIV